MILKVMREGEIRPWFLRDKIKKISWGYRPLGELSSMNYDLVSMSTEPLVEGEDRFYCECCFMLEDGTEMIFAFSRGYLLNDEGKTIEVF